MTYALSAKILEYAEEKPWVTPSEALPSVPGGSGMSSCSQESPKWNGRCEAQPGGGGSQPGCPALFLPAGSDVLLSPAVFNHSPTPLGLVSERSPAPPHSLDLSWLEGGLPQLLPRPPFRPDLREMRSAPRKSPRSQLQLSSLPSSSLLLPASPAHCASWALF